MTLPDGRVVTPEQVLGDARPGPEGRAHRRHGARPTASSRRRAGPTCSCTRRRSARRRRERARETEHSTALEAARVARDAGVTLLALTHLSSRYGAGDVEREARTVFPDTVVPRDFDLIEIPFEERGGPELVKSGARLPRAEVPSSA